MFSSFHQVQIVVSGEGSGQVNVTAMTLGPGGGPSACPVSFYLNQKYKSTSQIALLCLLYLYIYTTKKYPNVKQLNWAIN